MTPVLRARMRHAVRGLILACGLGLVASALHAQSLSHGSIVGIVTDAEGVPLDQTNIILTSASTGQRMTVRTSRLGRFAAGGLRPGVYDAIVERLGYLPHRIAGISIEAGERRNLAIALTTGTPPAGFTPPPTHADAGPGRGVATPSPSWLRSRTTAPLPFDGEALTALGAVTSIFGPGLAAEGMPAGYTVAILDGIPLAMRPRAQGIHHSAELIPLPSLAQAHVLFQAPDVEWYPGAGRVYGLTDTGTSDLRFAGWGEYSGSALSSATDAESFSNLRIGAAISGPIVGDTASYMIGFEYATQTTALAPLWSDTMGARIASAAAQRYGFDLSRFVEPATRRTDRVSGWAHANYSISRSNTLAASGVISSFPRIDGLVPGARPEDVLTRRSGLEAAASGVLTSRLSDGTLNEIYLGLESMRSERERDTDFGIPGTIVDGFEFGSPDIIVDEYRHTGLHARESMNIESAAHLFKLGASAQITWYDFGYGRDRLGQHVFPGLAAFEAGRSFFREMTETPNQNRLQFRRYYFFLQDRWNLAPGFELLAGLRYALQIWPDSATVGPNPGWEQVSGDRTSDIPVRSGEFEPRIALTWTPPGRADWVVGVGVAVDGNALEPADLIELYSNNGRLFVRELTDAMLYPEPPTFSQAPQLGQGLTIFGPEFRLPQTTTARATVRHTASSVSIGLAGTLRKTRFLPTRRDLNLLPAARGRDQHGRIVHGTLVKRGTIIATEPRSNRRLDAFDRVWALEAAGTSTYSAATLTIEHAPGSGIGFFGSYTFSRTTDDWMRARDVRDDAQASPFAYDPDNAGWVDATSDFDIPHRAVVGFQLALPGRFAPSIAALYRYRSGDPFTPGFRPGVDMNGDGLGRNDPAFVDQAIAGASDVIAEHACLRSHAGRFAERNACRAPDVQALDARISFELARTASYSATVIIDALNLIGSETGIIDRALYLVDGSQPLVTAANGDVTVPLLANPDFGSFIMRYRPERILRIGLRIGR